MRTRYIFSFFFFVACLAFPATPDDPPPQGEASRAFLDGLKREVANLSSDDPARRDEAARAVQEGLAAMEKRGDLAPLRQALKELSAARKAAPDPEAENRLALLLVPFRAGIGLTELPPPAQPNAIPAPSVAPANPAAQLARLQTGIKLPGNIEASCVREGTRYLGGYGAGKTGWLGAYRRDGTPVWQKGDGDVPFLVTAIHAAGDLLYVSGYKLAEPGTYWLACYNASTGQFLCERALGETGGKVVALDVKGDLLTIHSLGKDRKPRTRCFRIERVLDETDK